MKPVFDPIEERRILDGDTGYEWALARTFEEVNSKKALSTVANANLVRAIRCILVGYDEPAGRLLGRAQEWLTIAVQQDEQAQRFPLASKARRHFDLAQCAWLLKGERDGENFRVFLEIIDRHYGDASQRNGVGVSVDAVSFLDAGGERAILDLLLSVGVGPPSSFSAIRTEGQMAYVICRKRLGEAYADADVDGALGAFLKRHVNAWLIDGHYLRAALWMKVAHWRQGGPLTPQETVRKACDYLPGVARPAA